MFNAVTADNFGTAQEQSSISAMQFSHTLVVVDPGVDDYQILADSVIAGAKVHILDAQRDGVEQITDLLQAHYTLYPTPHALSLHLISHGAPGTLYLGNSQLNLFTLDRYSWDLQSWFALHPTPHIPTPQILLYGCQVAAGDAGTEFIEKLHRLTGANIAASTTRTGNAALGGNWELDVTVGLFRAQPVFGASTLAKYTGVLTTSPTNSNFETGSLTGWTVQTLTSSSWSTTQTASVVSSDKSSGSYSLKLVVNGSVSSGYGTAYGPAVTSSYFQASTGDRILFDWKALDSGDDYDVKGELINDATGQKITVFAERGDSRNWTTTTVVIPNDSTQWKFVFTAGSYDATGGKAVGSTLYIDNIRVVPAPTLDSSQSPTLSAILEDSGAPSNGSTAGATLVSALIDDSAVSGGLDNYTYSGSGGNPGMAITGVTNGILYYSTNGGSTWNQLSNPSNTSALLLAADSNTYVYFRPNTNVSGSISNAISFKAWNSLDGTNGQIGVNTTTNTGVSAQSDTVSISVTPVNDAPLFTGNGTLTAIAEDTTNSGGQLISTLFGGLFSDVDAGATLSGIAVTGNLASAETQGVWQYSIDNGANWFNIGTVDDSTALALSSNARLRFVPATNYNGAPPGLAVRAIDDSYAAGFTNDSNQITVNTSVNGGATPFSVTTRSLSTSVTSAPDVVSISSPIANGSYGAGTVIPIVITFDEAVTVTGTPQLALGTGGVATYSSGSGSNTLTFNYTVVAGQNAIELDYLSSNALSLNGGTIRGINSNNADLLLPAPGAVGSLGNSKEIAIDTTAPTVSVPVLEAESDTGSNTADNLTNDTTPTFTGTVEAGSTVQIYDGDTLLGDAIVSGTTWSYTPTLPAGTYAINAKATDAAGNTTTSSNLSLTIDTSVELLSTPDLDTASDTGFNTADNLTNATTPTFTGTVEAGSTVQIYNGDTLLGNAIVDGTTWTYTPSAPLAAGNYSINARATDAAGNKATSGNLSITIDTSVESLSTPDLDTASDTGSNTADNVTSNPTPTFTGTVEVDSTVQIYDGDTLLGDAIVDGTTWSYTPALAAGNYSINARATDAAGNTMTSGNLSVTIDTGIATPAAPDLSASSDTGTSDADDLTGNNTPTFTGTAEPGSTVTLTSDIGGPIGTATADVSGNWTITANPLADGKHNIAVTAADAAGNTATSGSLAVAIDAGTVTPSAPDLLALDDSGDFNTDDITNNKTPRFSGVAETGSTVTLTSDIDGVIGSATADESGNWTITTKTLAEGKHSITATSIDMAGNPSPTSDALSVTIDASTSTPSRPDLTVSSDTGFSNTDNITSNSLPVFTGTADAGSTVTLTSNLDGVLGTVIVDDSGNWSLDASVLRDGVHNITATAVDIVGNTSSVSEALSVTIDTNTPTPSTPDLFAASDTGLSDSDNNTSDSTPQFRGTAEPGSTVILFSDIVGEIGTATTNALGQWSITSQVLTNGVHKITATATDVAGNTSLVSGILPVTIAANAPTPPSSSTPPLVTSSDTGSSATDGITKDNTPTLGGTGTPGDRIDLFVGATSIGTVVIDASGKWSFTAPTLTDGVYTIDYTVTNPAGVSSAPAPLTTLTIDTTSTDAVIVEIMPDVREAGLDTINIRFSEVVTNFDLSELVLKVNGQPVSLEGATLATTDNQNWTLSNIRALTGNDGNYEIAILPGNITDLAGNLMTSGTSDVWLTGLTADAFAAINANGGKRGVRQQGGKSGETVIGTRYNDLLRGGKGSDQLIDGGRKDGNGKDRMYGEDGNDLLKGGNGKDHLDGGKGNDRLFGGRARDYLLGGDGNDRLNGDKGNDILVGGNGNDTLTGGKGRDMFTFNTVNEGVDTITDFGNTQDVIDLRGIFAGPTYAGMHRFAQFHDYVKLEQVGSGVEVKVDADGNGSGTTFNTLAVLQNQSINTISSRNFVVG